MTQLVKYSLSLHITCKSLLRLCQFNVEFAGWAYMGDVINAYNDGPSEQGGAPLGPFMNSNIIPSSGTEPNEAMQHVQTWHIKGPDEQLKMVAKRLLSVDLSDIEKGFVRQ